MNVSVKWFEHAIPAIEHLKKNKYPLILTDLEIAPGLTSD